MANQRTVAYFSMEIGINPRDAQRLKSIARDSGRLQVVFAGKAHPRDSSGKEAIKRIFAARQRLAREIPVIYVGNYNLAIAKRLVAGVDVWLNTPEPPLEASGTSGMKAAVNAVPSLSILDGWWTEGHVEGVTGWAIGEERSMSDGDSWWKDASSLYDKLGGVILPLFYGARNSFANVMIRAIAFNGSFFNTQRMIQQYVVKAYFE
jgi:glycogen phosphorylase